MRVTVLLFSQMRIQAERDAVELELPEGAHLERALSAFYARHPELRSFAPSCLVAVGLEYAPADLALKDGDEISIIPPVSGG
ncbi:MAG: MoaD/ThiS family protein [Candidatus Eisenbacteria bacterium]